MYQQTQTDVLRATEDVDAARGAVKPIEHQLRQTEGRLQELGSRQAEYHALTMQNEKTDQDSYRTFLQRADDARIADVLNRQNVSGVAILQAPTVPTEPALPKVRLMLGLAFLLGGMVGAAAALLREMMDDTFSCPDQLEAILRLPGHYVSDDPFAGPRMGGSGLKIYEALHPSPAETRAPRLVAAPRRAGGALRRAELVNLYHAPDGMLDCDAPRVFQLISATSGEGTTTIARELAGAVAETVGRRALLLTIMLRGPSPVRSLDAVLRGDIPLRAAVTRPNGGSHFTAGWSGPERSSPTSTSRRLSAACSRGCCRWSRSSSSTRRRR